MARTRLDADRDGFVGPTPERARIANGYLAERPLGLDPKSANKEAIGVGYYVSSIIQRMYDEGRLTHLEAKAAALFRKDFHASMSENRVTGRYGVDLAMAGLGRGTPVSQQKDDGHDEEYAAFHSRRFADACERLAAPKLIEWMTLIACEIEFGPKHSTVEDIGRDVLEYDSRQRSQGGGTMLLKLGCAILAVFYKKELTGEPQIT